ncbi:MAG: CDP-diacylglycerol--serine O-phosphatidyltransferase [Saprospiraceae bacterium]
MNFLKSIPNILTSLNLFSGVAAILINDPFYSPLLILAGGIFDLFDGAVARKVNASSKFGAELDSLADVISFGVAPAFLYFHHVLGIGFLNIIAVGILAVFTSLRLAKFNIDTEQKVNFVGLPSPASGIFFAFMVLESVDQKYINYSENTTIWFLLPIIFSYLMVSKIKFYALKKSDSKYNNAIKFTIVGIFLVSAIIWLTTGFPTIPIAIVLYMFISILYYELILR